MGIICNEVGYNCEDVNIYDFCIRKLSLKFSTESLKLQIEKHRGLVMGADTSLLIKLRWMKFQIGRYSEASIQEDPCYVSKNFFLLASIVPEREEKKQNIEGDCHKGHSV